VRERQADVRGLGRPSEFDGRADQWTEWSFKAKAWIVLNTEFGTVDLEKVSRSADPVDMRAMGATARTMEANTKLYFMLAMMVKGQAATVVRKAPNGHGLEAWRLLSRKYDPEDDQSSLGLLAALLKYDFGGSLHELSQRLDHFDVLLKKYESASETEDLPDGVKRALLLSGLPEPLATHIQMNGKVLDTFKKVRYAVEEYLRTKRVWSADFLVSASSNDGPAPMDIGAVTKGKGKSWGKKGTGKGHPEHKGHDGEKGGFQGKCHGCGQYGHKQAECPRRGKGPKGHEGKGKRQGVHHMDEEIPDGSREGNADAGWNNTDAGRGGSDQAAAEVGAVLPTGDQGQPSQGWVLQVTDEKQKRSQTSEKIFEILVDSGAYTHVAPLDFAEHIERDTTEEIFAYGPDGRRLRSYGVAYVPLYLGDVLCMMPFVIMNVQKVIMSVGRMCSSGCTVNFAPSGTSITKDGRSVPVRKVGQLYLVKAKFAPKDAMKVRHLVAPVGGGPQRPEATAEVIREDDDEVRQGQEPREPGVPKKPGEEEVRRHNLTHVPYAAWCESCVRGRGREAPSRRRTG